MRCAAAIETYALTTARVELEKMGSAIMSFVRATTVLLTAQAASGLFVASPLAGAGARASLRASKLRACAADDLEAQLKTADDLEAKLEAAVAREDYAAAAALKKEIDESPAMTAKLFASLKGRTSQLTSRRAKLVEERKLLKGLDDTMWPATELAQKSLWNHWFGEYGDDARDRLLAADSNAAKLMELMEEFPDWVEPANRLATLRFIEGDYADSVELCLRILRRKPWHFGASSGIVMCYAKLGKIEEANEWAKEAMPQPGDEREKWVKRMVEAMDARVAELDEIGGEN